MGTEVHVWRVPLLVTGGQLSHHAQCLSPDEKTRAQRFFFARDRNRFIAARGSLRRILAQYVDEQPHDLRIGYDSHGKPRLVAFEPDAGIEFNLSHSGDLALIAVARGFPVGIDIEQIRPESATAELAAEVFSLNEQAIWAATPEHSRAAAFFKCWTSKEAYIKGLGDGLGIPLKEFDVCVHPAKPATLLRPYQGAANRGSWSLHDIDPGLGYAAALATARAPDRIVMRDWHHAAATELSPKTDREQPQPFATRER